uniref:immunoglobulin kappa light chain-like n=1 Tax=Podarcis muralis TaxID=64176 RepID=UPI00109F3A8A|nr:immunoglobulin kappa light chain-like [Podarcis muralis]
MLQIPLIWLILCFLDESRGQIVITQTPASIQASPGDAVTIQCKASSSVTKYTVLYQFKSGQKPKLLIYDATNRFEGTPDRFSGSYGTTDFSFTINGVHVEDEAEYYCGQRQSLPLHRVTAERKLGLFVKRAGLAKALCYTFGAGTKLEVKRREDSTPLAIIFPPSPEQLKTDSATAVCLVSTFYPSSLTVAWKVDGTPVSEGVQTSPPASDTDNTYKLSSTLTLPTSDFNTHELYSCEVTHKTLSSPLVKSFRRSECSG